MKYLSEGSLVKLKAYWDGHPLTKKPWTWIPPTKTKPGRWVNAQGDVVPVEALLVAELTE